MRKDELRTRIRQTLRQFTRQALDELSLPIIARVKARLADARVVVAFHSLPDEVNTRQLLDELVGEGKTVLLPKVLDAERMELRRYTGAHDLSEGAFHIMEPVGTPFTQAIVAAVVVGTMISICFPKVLPEPLESASIFRKFLKSPSIPGMWWSMK